MAWFQNNFTDMFFGWPSIKKPPARIYFFEKSAWESNNFFVVINKLPQLFFQPKSVDFTLKALLMNVRNMFSWRNKESIWSWGYKTIFLFNLAEHEIFSAINKYENANNSWQFLIY